MKKELKKHIIIFISIVLFVTGTVIKYKLNNLDELWNFNFARSISNGLLPYRDFNIIQGPFVPLIVGTFLKIFGQEIFITRIITILIDSLNIYLIYIIMDKQNIKEFIKYIVLIIIAFIMNPYFALDYNWVSLTFVLLIINLELLHKESIKHQIIIGLLAGITITIKQTTGLIISIATIGWVILTIKRTNDFKKILKLCIYRLLGVIIIITSFLIILITFGILRDYIDYCILGIKTFSNSISYIDRLIKNHNILIKVLSVSPIITYVILLIMYIKTNKKEYLILFTYSIAQFIVVFPIADETHFILAIVPTLISIGYLINDFIKIVMNNKKIEIILNSFLLCFITLFSISCLIEGIVYFKNQNINRELKHFKYLPIEQEKIEDYKKIGNFINESEKKVYILDAIAAIYMIPLDRYNKDFDMFNIGNFGSKGEIGQIDKIKQLENSVFLIRNNKFSRNWQNPENVRNYIINNLNKTGEIGIFDIYEKDK